MAYSWDNEPQFQQVMLEQQQAIDAAEEKEQRWPNTLFGMLRKVVIGRWPIDYQAPISSSFPFIINTRRRRYTYFWSPIALGLLIYTLSGIGSLALPAQTWTLLPIPHGYPIFAASTSSPVYVSVRETDNLLSPSGIVTRSQEIASLSAGPGSGAHAILLPPTDVSAFKWFSIDIQGSWNGPIVFWQANSLPDNLTGNPNNQTRCIVARADGANTLAQLATQVNIAGLFGGVIVGRYLYIDIEPLTSGTVNAIVELHTTPPPTYLTVVQVLPSNNFIGFMGVGGKANKRFTSASTTTDQLIKNGLGAPSYIGTINIFTSGASQLDIFDDVPIPIVTTNPVMASVPANATPGPYVFNTFCAFGIAVQGKATNPDFSISYS